MGVKETDGVPVINGLAYADGGIDTDSVIDALPVALMDGVSE